MSYFNTEDENRAQHTEGFTNGFEAGESLYVITPEEVEEPEQSELDEQIYDENPEVAVDEPVLENSESENNVAPASTTVPAPTEVAKSSLSCVSNYISNPKNRLRLFLALVVLAAAVYYLHQEGYLSLPTLPFGMTSALGLDSASSSFAGSSASLGQNVMKLNNLL